MVAVSFLTSGGSRLDARSARLLFDIESDEPVGDPQVSATHATARLASGATLNFSGDFAALQEALEGDPDLLFLVLPQIRIDTISKSFPGGETILVDGIGVTAAELAPYFDESQIETGFQFFLRGNDTFQGDLGHESIAGYAGSDLILGMNGNDWIEGNAGDDEINGNKGDDIVDGGLDRDFARGGQENDIVDGGEGDDWHLNGNNANDTVIGGNGSDAMFGGKDDDLLDGGSGNDFLSGDLGDDVVVGGFGADVFAFDHSSGIDFLFDFHPEEGDRIGIRQDVNGSPLRTGADVLSRAIQVEEGTALDLGNQNFVLIDQYSRVDLRADHFVIF